MTTQFSRRDVVLRTAGLVAAGLVPAAGRAAPLHKQQREAIDTALQAKVAAREIPGVVAMAADQQSVIYQGAFGARSMSAPPVMTTDTIFRIASMVKLLTTVAALQLVERGKLKLDQPAADIDPTLAASLLLTGFDAKGIPLLQPPRQPVTLRHLLSHTSGFSYPLWDPNVVRYNKAAHGHPTLPRRPLMFEPGTKWSYGGSLDQVGRLVEIAADTSLDKYFSEHITGPLGMNDTAFNITDQQRARLACLHVRDADGKLLAKPPDKPIVKTSFSGGGGIFSTAPDYLTLLQALLNAGRFKGASILKPESVAAMAENQIGNLPVGILRTTSPALSNDVDLFPGARLRWGLGHMINLDPGPYGRKAGSLGWAGLLNTYYWIDPAARIAAVIMMQILPFADRQALATYREFERGIYRGLG